jgi:hypothetical protein
MEPINTPHDRFFLQLLRYMIRIWDADFDVILFDLQQTDEVELQGALLFRTAMKIAKYAHTHLRRCLGEILRAAPPGHARCVCGGGDRKG